MRHALIGLLCLAGIACNSPATIEIEPERPLLGSATDRLQLRATVKSKDGKVLGGVPVKYSSLTPTMLNVDETGTLSAVTSGMGSVLVEAGKLSKQVDVVIQLAKKIAIDPDSPMLMMGINKGFKATVFNDRDQPMIAGEIRWSSSDPEILTVDEHGNVKTKNEGEATLTVHAAGIQGSTKVTVKHEELREDGSLSQ